MHLTAIALALALGTQPTTQHAVPASSPNHPVVADTTLEQALPEAQAGLLPRSDVARDGSSLTKTLPVGLLLPTIVHGASSSAQTQTKPYDAYEAAKRKRTLGGILMLAGAATTVVGFAMTRHEVDSGVNACTPGSSSCGFDARNGALVAMGGAGVFAGGLWVFYSAAKELNQLEAQKKKASPMLTFPLGDGQAVELALGVRSTVSYRLGW
jgi:hypothetical protein